MLKSICLAAAMLAVAAVPALAAGECGPTPIGPAIPAASDLSGRTVEAGRAEVLDAYHQVKAYQASNQSFRACMEKQDDADTAALAEAQGKGDKDQVAPIQQSIKDLLAIYQKTIDNETQVATEFNDLRAAQCTRDTDPQVCPKKP